jgi:lipopolysaccharide/colanic/teichoic acid biosynthesis glycosyltransferase
MRRLLIVGESSEVERCSESFRQLAPLGWEWIGIASDTRAPQSLGKHVGTTHELTGLVTHHRATDLALAIENPEMHLCRTIFDLARAGIRVTDIRTFHEQLTRRLPLLGNDGAWCTALIRMSRRSWWTRLAKRSLDMIAGAIAFTAFALVLIPVAMGLALERAGSIFVSERRVGHFGRRFILLRFRTERDYPAGRAWPFSDPPAPLRTGAVIRRLGIDRLPQCLAILRGTLSLVGPRAAEVQYHERVEREFPMYLTRTVVKPGLTGWEQLHRESRITYDKLRPLEYDLYYIKHQSLGLDLRILADTALKVIRPLRIGG